MGLSRDIECGEETFLRLGGRRKYVIKEGFLRGEGSNSI
jgi:hypothetical protein